MTLKKEAEEFFKEPVATVDTVHFNVNNKVVPNDDHGQGVMKIETTKKGDKTTVRYYLKSYGGKLYDPFAPVLSREQKFDTKQAGSYIWKYKEVTSEIYDLYRTFIVRRNGRLFNEAQRLFSLRGQP